jgi:hypothetical protein
MSEHSKVPHFEVTTQSREPHQVVLRLGKIGLAHIICIEPAFDPPENYFIRAGKKNGTYVLPLHKVEQDEGALLVAVVFPGDDELARERLNQTVSDIDALSNVWEDPGKALEVMYFEE